MFSARNGGGNSGKIVHIGAQLKFTDYVVWPAERRESRKRARSRETSAAPDEEAMETEATEEGEPEITKER